jgi:hypothetical protein
MSSLLKISVLIQFFFLVIYFMEVIHEVPIRHPHWPFNWHWILFLWRQFHMFKRVCDMSSYHWIHLLKHIKVSTRCFVGTEIEFSKILWYLNRFTHIVIISVIRLHYIEFIINWCTEWWGEWFSIVVFPLVVLKGVWIMNLSHCLILNY